MSRSRDQSSFTEAERTALRADAAERIMGWSRSRTTWAYEGEAWLWCRGDVPVMACESWRPDEDDAQSMAVLDRMLELGFEAEIRVADALTEVSFRDAGGAGRSVDAERGLAVLKAALVAAAG